MNWMRREAAAQHLGERAHGQRLGQAGHALQQHVAAGQEADEQALEHRVLADDDALDLVERLLEGGARLVAGLGAVVVVEIGHGVPQGCFLQIRRPNQRSDIAAPRRSRTRRAAGEARRDLALLVLGAQERAQALVDVAELARVGGGVGLAARGPGDLGERLRVGRHLARLGAAGVARTRNGDRALRRAQRDGVDRDAQLARRLRRGHGIDLAGRRAVGEQHDGGRRALAVDAGLMAQDVGGAPGSPRRCRCRRGR